MKTSFNGIEYDYTKAQDLGGSFGNGGEEDLYWSESTGYFLTIRKCQRREAGEWRDLTEDELEEFAGDNPLPERFIPMVRPLSETLAAEWCLNKLVPEPLRAAVLHLGKTPKGLKARR